MSVASSGRILISFPAPYSLDSLRATHGKGPIGKKLNQMQPKSVFKESDRDVQGDLPTFLRSRARRWGVFVGFWTMLGVFSGLSLLVSQSVMGAPVPLLLAFRRGLEHWYPWGLLAVGVFWMARRFPFEPGRWVRWGFIHLGAAIVAAVVYVAAYGALLHGQTSVMDGTVFTFSYVFKKVILHYLLFNIVIYWMILTVQHSWRYYQQYQERERQASALATELVRARLEMLRMQLNPHFLFNTLNAISALIHEQPEAADRMVVRLSELLRRTLELPDSEELSLEQELKLLESYLEIERIRFADRLTVEIKVESGLERALVPALILQPIVENAIRHGIEPREEMGVVRICARLNGGRMELSVSDNGLGMPEGGEGIEREGIGLSNTRSRLAHLYGSEHELELCPAAGGGLNVRLVIPLREAVERGRRQPSERKGS